MLKNAKDACASEALEIATYTAIERLARAVGDDETAALAASIRTDEEKMLERVLREIPKLTDAVVRAEVKGDPSYDVTKTGAADAVREAGKAVDETARTTGTRAKRSARQARKVPGVARAEGQIKGAVASEGDLAIARYDTLTAEEIIGKLAELSQIDLAKVDAYERKNENRTTVLSRIDTLRGNEPWPGYDELTAAEVQAVLSEGDDDRAQQVRSYERSPQEPRRRPQGRRARARHRLAAWVAPRRPDTPTCLSTAQPLLGLPTPCKKEQEMSIADQARKVPGVAAAEGAITGAVATEQDLPIADYDKQTADDIAARLKGFSQRELRHRSTPTSASTRTARRSRTRSPS